MDNLKHTYSGSPFQKHAVLSRPRYTCHSTAQPTAITHTSVYTDMQLVYASVHSHGPLAARLKPPHTSFFPVSAICNKYPQWSDDVTRFLCGLPHASHSLLSHTLTSRNSHDSVGRPRSGNSSYCLMYPLQSPLAYRN